MQANSLKKSARVTYLALNDGMGSPWGFMWICGGRGHLVIKAVTARHSLAYLLSAQEGKCMALGLDLDDKCVMLLPDSSNNMTKILLDMSKLSNALSPSDDDVLTRMGKWFTGKFGTVKCQILMGIL